MTVKSVFRTTLIAPCGMDCTICTAHLRKKSRCGGCYTPDRLCRRNCPLFTCEKIRGRYHHACNEFPCRRLKQLDKRYREKYGMSVPANLEAIRRDGIRAFVKKERERWTCTSCGGTIDVQFGLCSSCGKERQ